MLFCSYCGSALVIEEGGGPERLILPHERSDRGAEEALRSYLAERSLARPKDIRTDFAYVPFAMIEDDRGHLIGRPGRGTWPEIGPLPVPPAGEYRFFNESLAGGEKVFAHDDDPGAAEQARRILFLPLYRVRYRAAGGRYGALVLGESWYVLADAVPPPRPSGVSTANVLAAVSLGVAYMFIGKLGHSGAARILVIMTAAMTGWAAYAIRARIGEEK